LLGLCLSLILVEIFGVKLNGSLWVVNSGFSMI
jgi:hypothetical protein